MPKLTFIFDDKKFEMEDTVNKHGLPDNAMGAANRHFDLPQGAWFKRVDDELTWVWHRGNFFD